MPALSLLPFWVISLGHIFLSSEMGNMRPPVKAVVRIRRAAKPSHSSQHLGGAPWMCPRLRQFSTVCCGESGEEEVTDRMGALRETTLHLC